MKSTKCDRREDSARRIIEQLRAVIEMERNPDLLCEAQPNFYEHVKRWAMNETWTVMHRVIKEGKAEAFFLTMAREVARPTKGKR